MHSRCSASLVIYDLFCRDRASEPPNFHPFCDATVFMITGMLTIIMTRMLATQPIPKAPGLLSREAAIAKDPAPTVVVPRFLSPESMVTRT